MKNPEVCLLLVSASILLSCVSANFFAKFARFGAEGDANKGEQVPSGVSASQGSKAKVGGSVEFYNGVPLARLSNGNGIPLIGLGAGSLHGPVSEITAEALQDDKKTYLIDTSRLSRGNEGLVAEGINQAVTRLSLGAVEVHVVVKVWYTHLGYARTKHSVLESLQALKPALNNDRVNLMIHVLLQWPRCFDNISWMDCESEERELSEQVKALGPDPFTDTENSWKESWKALEDMYLSDEYPIASIGLSNFQVYDIETMNSFAKITPHLLQVNLWSLLNDHHLIDYCHKHRIHVQVYNALQSTVSQPEFAPRAYNHIQKVAIELMEHNHQNIQNRGTEVTATPAQVILAWLIQHGVSVMPRTSVVEHLAENSAVALTNFPTLTDNQVETVAHSVQAYLTGKDLDKDVNVSVTFHAVNKDMVLYWMGYDDDETRIKLIRKGEAFHETTFPNHKFRTYLATDKDVYHEHEVKVDFGGHKDIYVEL